MASINDVAEKAGVSIATVSRVINKHPNVSEEKKDAVKKAIKELKYVPNALAQSLVTKTTHSVGLLIADITNEFYAILVRSVEDVLNKKGYYTVIGNTDWDEKKEKNYLDYLIQKQIDGFILASTSLKDDYINNLAKMDIPIIILDRDIKSDLIDKIRIDDFRGGYMAAEHLIKKGYKKLVHFRGPKGIASAEGRRQGFLECVSDYEIKDVKVLQGCFMENCGVECMDRYLQNNTIDQPVGIFVGNDAMSFGALRRLRKEGIKVPQQVGLVGFDDVTFAENSNPPLTTIKRPIGEIGRIAAEVILRRIEKDEEDHFKRDIKLNVKLIERETTMKVG